MEMRRPPGIQMVPPGIGARFNGLKPVATIRVGDAAAHAGEVRVEGSRMLVLIMRVPTGRVGLPHFDELMRNRPAFAVEHLTGDYKALTQRFPDVLDREVAFFRLDLVTHENRRAQLDGLGVDVVQVLDRMTEDAASVRSE